MFVQAAIVAVATAEQVSMLCPTRTATQGDAPFAHSTKRRVVGPLRWPAQTVCKGLPPRLEVSGLALSPHQPESTGVAKKAYLVAPIVRGAGRSQGLLWGSCVRPYRCAACVAHVARASAAMR